MVSSFPRLIAAAHVLHRLLAPRHPPCALVLLIRKNTFYCRYGVFKVRDGIPTPSSGLRSGAFAGSGPQSQRSLSKLNSVSRLESRHRGRRCFQASRCVRTAEAIDGSDAYRSKSSDIP
jgi:hypothetical protein